MRKLRRIAAALLFVLALPGTWLAMQWLAVLSATMARLLEGTPWWTAYREASERIVDAF